MAATERALPAKSSVPLGNWSSCWADSWGGGLVILYKQSLPRTLFPKRRELLHFMKDPPSSPIYLCRV